MRGRADTCVCRADGHSAWRRARVHRGGEGGRCAAAAGAGRAQPARRTKSPSATRSRRRAADGPRWLAGGRALPVVGAARCASQARPGLGSRSGSGLGLGLGLGSWYLTRPTPTPNQVRHKLVQSLLTKCRIHEPQGALTLTLTLALILTLALTLTLTLTSPKARCSRA